MVRRCFHCFLKILQVTVATILSIGSHTKKALRLWNWGRTTPPKKQHVPQGVTGQPGSKALLSWAAAKNKAWCLHTQNQPWVVTATHPSTISCSSLLLQPRPCCSVMIWMFLVTVMACCIPVISLPTAPSSYHVFTSVQWYFTYPCGTQHSPKYTSKQEIAQRALSGQNRCYQATQHRLSGKHPRPLLLS